MNASSYPRLCFEYEFDERTAAETEMRGYWGHSHVVLADGTIIPVTFYDPGRLAQDLEEEAKHGRPFIAETNLIVLESVTRQNMEAAIKQLDAEGFFSKK